MKPKVLLPLLGMLGMGAGLAAPSPAAPAQETARIAALPRTTFSKTNHVFPVISANRVAANPLPFQPIQYAPSNPGNRKLEDQNDKLIRQNEQIIRQNDQMIRQNNQIIRLLEKISRR